MFDPKLTISSSISAINITIIAISLIHTEHYAFEADRLGMEDQSDSNMETTAVLESARCSELLAAAECMSASELTEICTYADR